MKKDKKTATKKINAILDPSMRSHANDPIVLKKANDAKAFIDRVGLPKEYYDSQ